MSKLEPALQQTLVAWRVQSGEESPPASRTPEQKAIADRRIAVMVTYEGDVAALQSAGLDTGFDQDGIVSGQIAFRDLEHLGAVPGVILIQMEPPLRPLLDGTVNEMRVPWKVPPTDPWPGKGANTIVAVIDTGIDIFHDSFRKSDGTTRILELWDQAASTGGSNPPAAFQQIGRVYSQAQINAGITAGPPFQSVDNNGHGTHVAGTAAGNGRQDDRCSFPGRYVGVAPEADLVIVRAISLPAGVTPAIRDALQWCAQAGARHPGNKPVVINCSFGSHSGPHDGTSSMDGFIDQILRPASGPPAGIAIVCAAGNEGNSEIHEGGTVPANSSRQVQFYIPGGSLQPDTLELWYNGTATLNVTLAAPPNPAQPPPNTIGPFAPGSPSSPFTIGGMTIAVFSSTAPSAANNNKKQIHINISVPVNMSIRSGVWTLTLTETAGTAANWDAWVDSAGDDGAPTFRLPTDSGDAPARRRNNTVGSPGSSLNAITVANYSDDDGKINESSSRGIDPIPPGTPVGEVKPTIAAPGTGVAAPRSRDDPDTPSSCCDQKVIDKTGTSMASPHVAGLVALMLEKNKNLNFEQVRAHLQHSTRIEGIPAAEVPPIFDNVMNIRAHHIWGSGKVFAAAALAEMPAALGGGGGGGGGGAAIFLDEREWGYTPHTIFSRLGEWRSRFGPRPGLMLAAALISQHVDEILRLINNNPRVGAVWKRQGGPLLVRHLLRSHQTQVTLLPFAVQGCDVGVLIDRFLPILNRFGGERLKTEIACYRHFVQRWPGANLGDLDEEALRLGGKT